MTNTTPAALLGERWGKCLTARRKAKKYSQATLAARVGRDQPWVSRYERGHGNWTLESMLLFAAALDVSVEELFSFTPGIVAMEQFRLGIAA